MRSVDLDGIEQALGIKLPVAYRAAATEGRLEGLLNSDAGSVVAITHAFRNGDFGDRDWPATLFAFADDGAGNHFCIDLSSPRSRVVCRDHETL